MTSCSKHTAVGGAESTYKRLCPTLRLPGQAVSLGSKDRRHDDATVSASPTVLEIDAGGQWPSAASVVSSTRRLPPRVSPTTSLAGRPQPRFSGGSPAVTTTVEMRGAHIQRSTGRKSSRSPTAAIPPTVSVDGLLLFIGDTNIFPALSFEVSGEAALPVRRLQVVSTHSRSCPERFTSIPQAQKP